MLIIGPSGSGKTNALLNLIQKQDNDSLIDKIYLYAKEPKYQFLIKKREDAGIKSLNDPNAFIEYSNAMDDAYNNIDDYNLKRKRKILFAVDDMIADITTNKRFQAIIKELFIRSRKLKMSLVFITQSYFSVSKEVRLNSTHYLIMKIQYKQELQQNAINHSAGIDYRDFLRNYRNFTRKSFLTIDTALATDSPMRLERIFRFSFIKMTLTEQVKILNDKIKANKVLYDLDRETAKISALSSGGLEKYEYLTREDSGCKLDVIKKEKFEYSVLVKVFNKGLHESDKKEGLLKRLKKFEGKNKD